MINKHDINVGDFVLGKKDDNTVVYVVLQKYPIIIKVIYSNCNASYEPFWCDDIDRYHTVTKLSNEKDIDYYRKLMVFS